MYSAIKFLSSQRYKFGIFSHFLIENLKLYAQLECSDINLQKSLGSRIIALDQQFYEKMLSNTVAISHLNGMEPLEMWLM